MPLPAEELTLGERCHRDRLDCTTNSQGIFCGETSCETETGAFHKVSHPECSSVKGGMTCVMAPVQ